MPKEFKPTIDLKNYVDGSIADHPEVARIVDPNRQIDRNSHKYLDDNIANRARGVAISDLAHGQDLPGDPISAEDYEAAFTDNERKFTAIEDLRDFKQNIDRQRGMFQNLLLARTVDQIKQSVSDHDGRVQAVKAVPAMYLTFKERDQDRALALVFASQNPTMMGHVPRHFWEERTFVDDLLKDRRFSSYVTSCFYSNALGKSQEEAGFGEPTIAGSTNIDTFFKVIPDKFKKDPDFIKKLIDQFGWEVLDQLNLLKDEEMLNYAFPSGTKPLSEEYVGRIVQILLDNEYFMEYLRKRGLISTRYHSSW